MNILLLINNLGKGGAESVVITLIQHLTRLKEVETVHLMLLEERIEYQIPDNVPVIVCSKDHQSNLIKLIKLPFQALILKNYCRRNKIQIVFSFLGRSNYVNAFSKKIGFRHLCLMNEAHVPSQIYNTNNIKDIINRWLLTIFYPKAERIIAVSQGVKDDLKQNFKIPAGLIDVIYNPFDLDLIEEKSKTAIAEDWLVHKNYTNILTVGRLYRLKRHTDLINSIKILHSDIKKIRLIIIGDGLEKENLENLISQEGLQDHVKLLGPKENPFAYMSKADIFVLTSETEGFANVLVEAMACGCPVISTDCQAGPAEILAGGEYGILVPVGDISAIANAIKKLIESEELQDKLKKKGIQRAKFFAINKIIKKYQEILSIQDSIIIERRNGS